MSVVNSIESVGACRKRVHIEVPAPAVDAETQRVVREYGKKIRIKGFRAGKVPSSVVQQRFRSEIEREVLDRLVPRYWKQAQAESAIEPLLPPRVEDVELRAGEPLQFVATVEVRPPIELGDVDSFELPEAETVPSEAEIDDAVQSLQAQVADWVEVTRPVARGDRVTIESVEIGADDAPVGEATTGEVEVGAPRVWEELSLALTGLEVGQETDFRRQEGEGDEARVRHFRVKVRGVKERDLQPLDDALAKKIGALIEGPRRAPREGEEPPEPSIATLEALRGHVGHRLQHEKEHQVRLRQEQAVLDQLRQRHPIELPQGVVDEEVRGLLQEYAENLARQGVDVEKATIDWDGLAREVRPQAERRVHARLLLDAVADQRQIEVEPPELEERLALLARSQGRTTSSVRQALAQSGQLDALRRQMRREKTINALVPAAPHDHDHDHGHESHEHDHDHDH